MPILLHVPTHKAALREKLLQAQNTLTSFTELTSLRDNVGSETRRTREENETEDLNERTVI